MSITDDELNKKIALLEKKAEDLANKFILPSQEEANLQKLADGLSLLVSTDDSLLNQFQRNMKAFKTFDYNIYQYFSSYHAKEYMVDIVDGFVNIFDKKQGTHFYQYPPFLMSLAQLVEYQDKPQSTHSAFEINEENNCDFLHSRYLNKVIEVLEERADKEQDDNKGLPDVVSSLVLFGVGVGYHIELLVNQHCINNLYIIEPEIDVFYASLYTANWAGILAKLHKQKCNLHFSIGMQDDDFFNDLLEQTYQNGRYNIVKTFGYIHYNTPKISNLLRTFKERFKEMIQGWGFFDDGIMAIAHTLGNLNNNVRLLKKSAKTAAAFKDVPVFIIGNGPSLDQSIDQIKAWQDKAIIISCGSALSALMRYGVNVDYHCEQERTYPVVEKVKDYGDPTLVKQHILLAPSTLHPGVFELFDQGIMCAKSREPSTEIITHDEQVKDTFEAALFVNPTVANTAISMSYLLGYREFYFFGVDLGHKEGGSHHSKKSLYYSNKGEDLSLYEANDSDNVVIGNFSGEFICNDFFNMSRRSIEKLLNHYHDISCFNLSDGAKIEGASALTSIDLTERSVIDKTKHLHDVYQKTTWKDENKALYERVLEKSTPEFIEKFCALLKEIITPDITSIQDGIDMLKEQTRLSIQLSFTKYKHAVSLFDGSLLHYQAMLTRLLYEASDKNMAISDFNKAKAYYCQFLVEAPDLYRKNYTVPQVSTVEWWND